MTREYLIIGLLALLAALGGALWWQLSVNDRLRDDVTALESDLSAAKDAVKIEHRTQTVIREIHVKATEAQADVKAAPDPECANPEPVLDAWRGGIDRLRPETRDAHRATVNP